MKPEYHPINRGLIQNFCWTGDNNLAWTLLEGLTFPAMKQLGFYCQSKYDLDSKFPFQKPKGQTPQLSL